MKKIIIAGLLAGALFIGGTGVHAAEIQKDGQTYYEVEAGDTLSAIGNKYGLDHSLIHQSNLDTVSDANMIFVGDLLLIPINGEVQAPATAAVVAVAATSASAIFFSFMAFLQYGKWLIKNKKSPRIASPFCESISSLFMNDG